MFPILLSLLLFTAHQAGAEIYSFNHCHATDALKFVVKYLPENPVIVDAGAYDGQEIDHFFAYWPHCTVHAFEPIPQNFKKLVERTKHNPRIYRYQCALGDTVAEVNMHVSTEGPNPDLPTESSSLLPPLEHLKYVPTILFLYQLAVPCITLDAWAKMHDIDHVDLLWLDLQGYEFQVLHAAPQVLQKVRAILTEVEFVEAYKGQALFWQVRSWLENQGFQLIASSVNPDAPTVWYGDALFVRREYV